MARGLRTVRQKLTALVLLPVAVMLTILPGLWWVLDRQLLDEVDDRVAEAHSAFDLEFDDDIGDVAIAARLLAQDPETPAALASPDRQAAQKLAERFRKFFPDFDILFVDARGQVAVQLGCQSPRSDILAEPGYRQAVQGREFSGVVLHGCESSTQAPPAYVLAVPLPGGGAVIVCLPLTLQFLNNAAKKVGVELALLEPMSAIATVATARMPVEAMKQADETTQLLHLGDDDWAVARVPLPALTTDHGPYLLAIAHDVSDIRDLVRNNMLIALGFTLLVGSLALLLGTRVASLMSQALSRVSSALKRMEVQEYVTVSPVRTGDELEDLAEGFNHMVEGLKERDKLRDTFGKYMTEAVAEHLLKGDVELGGKTMTVSILFTDIREFTTISERMPAQRVVEMLNIYFTTMVGIIMEEGGVVDKYIGDAIMAVFGAPVGQPGDTLRAVRAAVRMREALGPLNQQLMAQGYPELRTGIGIHTGSVVAGNIGSDKRMEYTVIGDAVNLASRLESQTKELGVGVLISQTTFDDLGETIEAHFVKEVFVKGRAEGVRAYSVIGIHPGPQTPA